LGEDKSKTLDYDGIGTILFPSIEVAEAFYKDAENQKTMKGDPKVWVQVGLTRFMAGEEVVFFNQVGNNK
jgi:hypothetical protein